MPDDTNQAEQALATLGLSDNQPVGWVERQKFDYEAYTAERGTLGSVGNETRYEWKDEYGDVGPRVPAIEKALFEGDSIMTAGDELNK
jgi:ATP-dependent RNA helicase DDX3X